MGLPLDATMMLIISILARSSAVAANGTTWVVTPELYKTEIRGTGHSSCNAFTRIGAFLSPFVVQSQLSNASVGTILFIINCIGIIVSMLIPETIGRDLDAKPIAEQEVGR